MKWMDGDHEVEYERIGRWKVYEYDTPQCTHCGMWMPFARYRKGQGTNVREITDFCPWCGAKMVALPMCSGCPFSEVKDGIHVWQDNGTCYSCRGQRWIPNKHHWIAEPFELWRTRNWLDLEKERTEE